MKKQLLLLFGAMAFGSVQAQDVADALRYAQDNINGTARFRAMSGAFGAIGGDLSAINVNPAGSAVFANSQVGASLSSYNTKNKSSYFGTKTSDSDNAFDLNQAGVVFVLNNPMQNTGWKKLALSVNYDSANRFDNAFFTAGVNTNHSVADYFVHHANQLGLPANFYGNAYFDQLSLRERQAFMGYNAYIIDPLGGDPNSNQFISNVPNGSYAQDNFTETTGYNGKVTLNASSSYNDRFYFGINLNAYFSEYTKYSSFYEQNDNDPLMGRPSVNSISFDQQTYTYGNGFSFQLGAIAKITQAFRAGLSYESPTWYEFSDEVWQIVYSTGQNYGNGSNSAQTDSNMLILYEPYNLRTPGKFTGSLGYVFGKTAILSADYSVKDYSNTRFRSGGDYFRPVNAAMSNQLGMAGELRIGAEVRAKAWSFRGGFRYEESPYENVDTIGDLTSFSAGFGYQFPRTRLDLSYTFIQRETQQGLFAQGLTDPVINDATNNNVTLSLIFEL
ncbi:OmpP1/FadL family transporter [Flavobacterium caeni]|uniref:Long-chain fatty acid transport protein n=1 Tax=Flavobacterium caeni TaxID=490189 RepID=A0A1G5ANU6_9FLAO|nr:outer membrane protein transport protein [Flavobacterium caeni]SCX79583.1 Long-chain fatty acid transport protein [Flavobacterium caeni]